VKALKSDLDKRMLLAGVRIVPGVPVFFDGKRYVPKIVPARPA
jgi:hypothetical protein